MKRVYQPHVSQPTRELAEQMLKNMMAHPKNNELIDNYREMKRRMAEAEAKQAVDAFISEVTATEEYKKWLEAGLKKDEKRRCKQMPAKDVQRVLYVLCFLFSLS